LFGLIGPGHSAQLTVDVLDDGKNLMERQEFVFEKPGSSQGAVPDVIEMVVNLKSERPVRSLLLSLKGLESQEIQPVKIMDPVVGREINS
jgi:hypothetical protein